MIHRKSFVIIASLDFFAIDVYLGIVFTSKKFIILDDSFKSTHAKYKFQYIFFRDIYLLRAYNKTYSITAISENTEIIQKTI